MPSCAGAPACDDDRMATADRARPPPEVTDRDTLTLASAAVQPTEDVLAYLASSPTGLSHGQASTRLAEVGANALRSHGARPFAVLVRQLRNPLLILLVAAALASFAVGEHDRRALIILAIICAQRRARVRQRVPLRAGGRGAALADPPHGAGDARRRAAPASTSPSSCPATSCSSRSATSCRPTCACCDADGLECDEAVLTGESHAGREAQRAGRRSRVRARPRARARSWARSCARARAGRRRAHRAAGRVRRDRRCGSASASRRPRSSSACATSRCCSCGWPAC